MDLKERFGVTQKIRNGIFKLVKPRPASDILRQILVEDVAFALMQGSEKARSEFIIAPVLRELRQQTKSSISIFSGIEFNIDFERGLSGFCDFLISRSPEQTLLEAPVVVAVEAKQDDFKRGITQCIAEMIAAQIYNQQQGNQVTEIYGCVTIGNVWQFLVLRGKQALIETETFDVQNDLERILGILWACATGEISLAEQVFTDEAVF